MARNGHEVAADSSVSQERLRQIVRHQRIADTAVHKAIEENHRLGLSNGHARNGKIVSDIQLAEMKNGKK